MAKMIHFVMSGGFLEDNLSMMNSCTNATNSIFKVTNSIFKVTNSIAKVTNSIAKATNSIARTCTIPKFSLYLCFKEDTLEVCKLCRSYCSCVERLLVDLQYKLGWFIIALFEQCYFQQNHSRLVTLLSSSQVEPLSKLMANSDKEECETITNYFTVS